MFAIVAIKRIVDCNLKFQVKSDKSGRDADLFVAMSELMAAP